VDLSFSPDIDALWCYLIVFACGFFVVPDQNKARLEELRVAGFTLEAWALFFSYWLIPIALFWLLDQMGAVNDTSVFAAIMVGLAYKPILSGEFFKERVPGEMGGFWRLFTAWAGHVLDRVRERMQRNDEKLKRGLTARVVNDSSQLQSLLDLALAHTANERKLRDQIAAVELTAPEIGAPEAARQKAGILYESLAELTDFHTLLYRQALIPSWDYFWMSRAWRKRVVTFCTWAALVLAILLLGWSVVFSPPPQYYFWRLQKRHSTEQDRDRTRKGLSGFLAADRKASFVCDSLADTLRAPGLSMERAETILGLLLEHRQANRVARDSVVERLTNSLRADNPDVRLRIHDALLFLAEERQPQKPIPDDLRSWPRSKAISRVETERLIRQWHDYWKPDTPPQS